MKKGIKLSSLLLFLYLSILLVDIRFFYSLYIDNIVELVLAALMMILLFFFAKDSIKHINRQMPFMLAICIITIVSFSLVFIYTSVTFDQSFKDSFLVGTSNYKMLLIILVYPLSFLMLKNGIKKIFLLLNVISFILNVISLIQYVVELTTGVVFLQAISIGGTPFLNGSLRISMSWIGNIMILYNFYMFFVQTSGKISRKIGYFLLFILGMIDCFMIARVRGVVLIIIPCLIISVIINRTTKANLLVKIAFIAGICIFAYFTDYIGEFLDSFSLKATRAYSTGARLYAIEYYWNYFLKHPVFGFGFASILKYPSIVQGDGRAAISDVGIFGQLARYGIFVVLIYVFPLIRSIVIVFKARKNTKIKDISFFITLSLFVLGTSVSLIAIDHFRMLLWPLYLSIIEYVNYINKKNDTVLEL